MNRKILLIEPNYKNKYPPMGVMKISTYYKNLGDNVTFFKGDLKDLVLQDIYNEVVVKLYKNNPNIAWELYKDDIILYLKKGNKIVLEKLLKLGGKSILKSDKSLLQELLEGYRKYYYNKGYFKHPKYDKVGITTLFTFNWDITIDTINFAKKLCKNEKDVIVGGIMSSILPDKVKEATGIEPIVGQLNKPGMLGDDNDIIVDELPLDYSILYEIDYKYPVQDAYFAYMTRGCVNKCAFCAVPKLEPHYNKYISLKNHIDKASNKYGTKRNLLLLDNNILASEDFYKIIDEIKECGFEKGSKYIEPNMYEIFISNLKSDKHIKGYIKEIVGLYKKLVKKLNEEDATKVYKILEKNNLLDVNTAKKEKILEVDKILKKYFEKIYKPRPKKRVVDFNQGVDARLITEEKMKKLSEICIQPLRIAFDNWNLRETYENAIRLAAKYDIKNLSNYLLYNFNDKPIDLYNRLKMNVDLCEELDISIYSFPMKYHPIDDPKFFKNRDYLGQYWNRKFIRAIQSILNSTKGKIGKGKSFFEKAFGKDTDEFFKILYMPETFIIYRSFCDNTGITQSWWEKFNSLNEEQLKIAKYLIEKNNFLNIESLTKDKEILQVLTYYTLTKDEIEIQMKKKNNEL